MTTEAAANFITNRFSAYNKREAERLRSDADHQERLASAADADGDKWDATDCRAKAAELRRSARRLEIRP